MYNILGPKGFEGEYHSLDISEENVFLKMYCKKISKPSRSKNRRHRRQKNPPGAKRPRLRKNLPDRTQHGALAVDAPPDGEGISAREHGGV